MNKNLHPANFYIEEAPSMIDMFQVSRFTALFNNKRAYYKLFSSLFDRRGKSLRAINDLGLIRRLR